MSQLHDYRALVLNADYRPLATFPVSTMPWTESIKNSLAGKVVVVSEYDRVARSARASFAIPSVVALKDYVDMRRPAPLNRMNLFVRDRLCCVYCGGRFSSAELTFDHVVPVSKGGRGTWDNLASACMPCNQRKGNRTPEQAGMALRGKVYRPSLAKLNAIGSELTAMRDVPVTWRDWLYWTVQLEE